MAGQHEDIDHTGITGVGGATVASGARVYNNANLALTSGVATALTFNTERWDDATYHDTGSNTGRLTVSSAGRYLIGAHVQVTSAGSTTGYVYIRQGGTTIVAVQNLDVGNGELFASISTVWDCTAGTEYFEFLVLVSAASKNAIAASAYSPEFWIEKLGTT